MVERERVPAQPEKIRITFSLPASIWADRVQLIGDFNGWDATKTPLRRDETGWSASVLLDQGRAYTYCYLVDHECIADWNVDGYAIGSDGGQRSIVIAKEQASAPT